MACIGIFGGTFDPIHNGHLNLARTIIKEGVVDSLLMMVSNKSPHKLDDKITPFEDRFKMVSIALETEEKMIASDFERTNNTSFTYDTLSCFQTIHPNDTICLIIGSDSLAQLHTWSKADLIVEQFKLITYPRPHVNLDHFDQHWDGSSLEKLRSSIKHNLKMIDISSTTIRKSLQQNQIPQDFLPKTVYDYIKDHKLYIS